MATRTLSFGLAAAGLLFTTIGAVGCSRGVSVRPVQSDAILARMRESVRGESVLSFRTEQLLRRFNLLERYRRAPGDVLSQLDAMVRARPEREVVFVLAELCYTGGRQVESVSRPMAIGLYLRSVAYAYYFLFDPAVEPPEANVYDPRFRGACDIYNRSLAACIRLAQKEELRLENTLHVEMTDETMDVKIQRHGFSWGAEDFSYFRFARDYDVDGLNNQYQSFGLGVPLIAIRKQPRTLNGPLKYYPEEVGFPATAFLRMEGSITGPRHAPRVGSLDLFDPLHVQTIAVGSRTVPLESDLSTPLAYFLSRFKPEQFELTGMLRGDDLAGKEGLYLLQPYEPGKIPVVMVHGLWSSPMAWMQMFNDLRGDPAIRNRFQFWFYLYPTGNPIPFAADHLRSALDDVRTTLDPQKTDPAMDRMVVVGHSMGALLVKTLLQESGDALWKLACNQPLDKLDIDPLARERLRATFFFHPRSYVHRVVFMNAPHRGSTVSTGAVGRLGSRLIVIPKKLRDLRDQLVARNPNASTGLFHDGLSNAVDNLSPGSAIIQTLAGLPITSRAPYHSILSRVQMEGPLEESTDGVVTYASGHLEGAASELVVNDGHNCLNHSLTILEVRRILVEHLRAEFPEEADGVRAR